MKLQMSAMLAQPNWFGLRYQALPNAFPASTLCYSGKGHESLDPIDREVCAP